MDEQRTAKAVTADTRLASTPRRKSTLIVPDLLLADLDDRIAAMERAGKGRIARSDVIAALLVASTRDADALASLVERYRSMSAGEFRQAIAPDERDSRVIRLPSPRRAGRPGG